MAIKTEYKGHTIAVHPDGTFEVTAYGETFGSEKDARKYLDQHVASAAKKSVSLMDLIKGTHSDVLKAASLSKASYESRTGTPGHYKYKYHANAALVASNRAKGESRFGKTKMSKLLAHEEAADAHGLAAKQARANGDDSSHKHHIKQADKHLTHSDYSENLSTSEREQAYHHHTEAAKNVVDPAGGDPHEHAHAANMHGAAADHAIQCAGQHHKDGNKAEAKRWEANANEAIRRQEFHQGKADAKPTTQAELDATPTPAQAVGTRFKQLPKVKKSIEKGAGILQLDNVFASEDAGNQKMSKMGVSASPMTVAASEDPAIDGEAPTGRGSKSFGLQYSKRVRKHYGLPD